MKDTITLFEISREVSKNLETLTFKHPTSFQRSCCRWSTVLYKVQLVMYNYYYLLLYAHYRILQWDSIAITINDIYVLFTRDEYSAATRYVALSSAENDRINVYIYFICLAEWHISSLPDLRSTRLEVYTRRVQFLYY
jgi:hypothetical protein